MDQVSVLVEEMGLMGIVMGQELNRQNRQITHIGNRVETANERLHNANNRIERQL